MILYGMKWKRLVPDKRLVLWDQIVCYGSDKTSGGQILKFGIVTLRATRGRPPIHSPFIYSFRGPPFTSETPHPQNHGTVSL